MNLIHFSSLIHFGSLIRNMSMFSLTISSLTMSSLPWFMDLTFQVPMKYRSLQHWTLLSPPDTSAAERHFCFYPTTSFSLELLVIALCSSLITCWIPSDLGRGEGARLLVSYLFVFSRCSLGSCSKNPRVGAASSSSVPGSVTTLPCAPSVLGGPAQHGL